MSIYQDVEAKSDTEETQESIILRVHLPDGFAREHVGAKVEYGFARVRVHGERSLGNNIRVRFNTLYQVPEYCDMNKIKGKVDGKTVIITIPTIPDKVPKKEREEPPKEPPQETEANNTVDENQDASTPADDNQEKTKSTNENEEEVDHETSTPPNATQEEAMHQKGQGEVEEKSATTQVKSEKPVDQEKSTPTKDTEESKSQEGQEETPPKDDSTKVDHDGSSSTPEEHTKESMPQKGQEETPQEATCSTNDKLQGEEKQKAIGKEESEEEHSRKGLESGKAHEKDEEIKEERKGLRTFEGEKMNGKIGNDVGDKGDEKNMPESTRSRIKEVAASASQAVTGLAKRFNEEDKQKMIYMGAAVLVVALGVYATYKLRLRRQ
ncbi:hypothetical protein LR48_Vigan07g184800 [Vigna angularis]|uniref:SHSP domain-containing protein n=2 Tax=Phaseolus angularis TaxID=3914 RepID=A0A0L9V046_PHAAN|nr:uncharacterized protein LOC108337719 [Vigna angularis]KAG2389813.1 uncharacterized protein HKW66_Vig0178860 [Vigna angularis]KOM48144.1 hypothetical protein LR48_Vigan07g184800 [Vigna angularis]BAT82038.1 hypothetical protein VIGAN_03197900 [Vigna angularis var. angularis]